MKQKMYVKNKDLILILAQGFYGNRTLTEIKKDEVDQFISSHHDSKTERKIIHVPNHEGLVIVYHQNEENERLDAMKKWYEKKGYVTKPLAIIPELDLKIYSRCIGCRLNEANEFESLKDHDCAILSKYFSL